MFDKVAVGAKIRKIRLEKGLTQEEVAEKLNRHQTGYGKIEQKGSDRLDILQDIAQALNVPLGTLLEGNTEPATATPPLQNATATTGGQAENEKSNVRMVSFTLVPVLSIATAASCGAGNGLNYADFEQEQMLPVESSKLTHTDQYRKPFGIHIEGDSMEEAEITENSIAIINPAEEPANGNAALVSWQGNWYIKWVIYNPDGSIELRSSNPAYTPIKIEPAYAADPDFFQIIGKVIDIKYSKKPRSAF